MTGVTEVLSMLIPTVWFVGCLWFIGQRYRARVYDLECALEVLSQLKSIVRPQTLNSGPYKLRAGDSLDFRILGLELVMTTDSAAGITVVYTP